jgi:hypothetical protein
MEAEMFRYGFELEGFYFPGGVATIPPKEYPTDGFPGLVELRTIGGESLSAAYAFILSEFIKYKDVNVSQCSGVFDAKQRADLRRRHTEKSQWDIRNIYGKSPRLLGNKTIASCQINISNLLQTSYKDDKGVLHPERYGLFDVAQIVRNLDEAFSDEIFEAGRQPGEYCIKNNTRLEYRSLPNFAFELSLDKAQVFLDKIKNCVEY